MSSDWDGILFPRLSTTPYICSQAPLSCDEYHNPAVKTNLSFSTHRTTPSTPSSVSTDLPASADCHKPSSHHSAPAGPDSCSLRAGYRRAAGLGIRNSDRLLPGRACLRRTRSAASARRRLVGRTGRRLWRTGDLRKGVRIQENRLRERTEGEGKWGLLMYLPC